jgi:hypothetical protein
VLRKKRLTPDQAAPTLGRFSIAGSFAGLRSPNAASSREAAVGYLDILDLFRAVIEGRFNVIFSGMAVR